MQSIVGGNLVYPNLQGIADLFRALINDTANNTQGNGVGQLNQAGVIMPNSNPDLVTFLSSGVRTMFSDLRNVGDPELILDNYIVSGLPALTAQNPAVQVALAYNGFFDGFQWHAGLTLPVGAKRISAIWERETGSNLDFVPMKYAPFGLPSALQGNRMGIWETREGMVWMPGALLQTDIRIRARISYPTNWNVANLDYSTTYVPILNCADWVAAKMLKRYALRFAPERLADATQMEREEGDKVKLEVVRDLQKAENQRSEFGNEAVQDFAVAWAWL
jgi:hypothetical protein